MTRLVAIIGEGVLADYVFQHLTDEQWSVVRYTDFPDETMQRAVLAIVASDGCQPSVDESAQQWSERTGTSWLRGFASFGEAVIGPLIRPGRPGCAECADLRRIMTGSDRREHWQLRERQSSQSHVPPDAWAARNGLFQAACLIASEARRVIQGQTAQTEDHIILLNLQSLSSSRHMILPEPLCSVCSQLPDDSEETARISLQPSPKLSTGSYRCRSTDELKDVLIKDYLDPRTGLFNGKMLDMVSPFADVLVNMPMFGGDEGTAGRTQSYTDSELTAILEGLERRCGMMPRGKRTAVRDSYRNLEHLALNPLHAGVHAKEHYERPDYPFQPFHPDRTMNWVWGHSFLHNRPILVPELLAYYSMGHGDGFVYETSNGCALGGSLEEAIFYGILEVVERDSFLMTWYAQLPIPRMDLYSIDDREYRLMVERLQAVTNYDLHLFNATMEHGIPSVWVLAKNRTRQGINLMCAAGAHPDPVRAVKSAIQETAGMLETLNDKFESHREHYMRMLDDPYLVRQMDDHSMLYGLPEAEERLAFLLEENRPLRTFNEEFERKEWHADLTDDLKDLLTGLHRFNMDVIVVDQTTPETLRNGLYCVKVLIPGMLPMTFGHHLTRLTGLERVLKVPMKLGYARQILTAEQLNPYPHPFP
ncbi:bacteriocin biosynthesis protein SagD [Cohnella kolymensis]|uniref:Bacteriocin biosynthesis protein SagD n=1 Tax=Cohnella kolymensis TaxID=1590652 RepID=A0ABR5A0G3_9BACL|nr:TOMM precursor leader peptide-binding protein [Cohnella kolymensis]KIL34148.1 bacteriocin biosynthesis protein SagD [Cohnella kolymensis]